MHERLLARYGSPAGAAAYRRKYERSLARRLSHRREMRILARALAEAGVAGHVLDCPCGAGRLVPTILSVADRVTGADLSMAMVRESREALGGLLAARRLELAAGSAAALPFASGAFDAVVCHRLLHHIPGRTARVAILRELARVARRAVVFSFSDATTLKGRWQRLRGRHHKRIALTPREVVEEAAEAGLAPAGSFRRLWGLTSLVTVAPFRVVRR